MLKKTEPGKNDPVKVALAMPDSILLLKRRAYMKRLKRISIDNGNTYCTAEEAIDQIGIDTIVNYMDDDTRELVNYDMAPCADIDFLNEYLSRADDDLIIG